MPVSGKYDFKGIKKWGAVGLKAALASTPYTAWILKGGKLTDLILEFFANWLANNGLVVFNIGAITVSGEFDQKSFDATMDDALKKIELSEGKLTPAQGKAIDDEVIKAFRQFAILSTATDVMPVDGDRGLQTTHQTPL